MDSRVNRIQQARQAARQQAVERAKMQRRAALQVASQRALMALQESGFNQVAMKRHFRTLEEQQRLTKRTLSKSQNADEEVEVIEETKAAEDTASRFNKRNHELKIKTLLILRDSITEEDSVEDILRKVLDFYPDYTLADEALDFLLETTKGKLALKVQQAKDFLNENYKREIVAGKNIALQAQTFSKAGLGSPTTLRDMYRDITGNPRTPYSLFDELSNKFSYDSMRVVIRFLLHSLGADLKAKGPSITRPELTRLIEDTQILQAILGVYRFFISRDSLIASQFDHYGLIIPSTLTFELLSKLFINLLKERYITSEKIITLRNFLGISNEIIAQIIVFTQMKDALRNTSKRLYKSDKHRQEILDAFLETLEELEEECEEEDNV